jgi:radical SAM superfamily enzyme YgiQ (UPF0313 family)
VIGAKNQVRKAQPPLGIAYLAAILEENGYRGNIMCLDAVVEGYDNVVELEDDNQFVKYGLSDEGVVERLKDFKPDLVGITSLFSSMTECAFSIAESVKRAFPHVPIVMGGNHASNTADQIMKSVQCIDFIIKGESEYSLLEFVNKYFGGKDITNVPGLVFRKGNRIVVNKGLPFNKQLDDLPDPAFHLFPMERYFEIGMPHNPFVKSGRVGSIMTSRGCPEHCYFCTSPDYTGTAFRAMSPERVIRQIKNLIDQDDIKELQILDDNFTVNYKRVIAICEGIKDFGLRITLPNAIRADMPTNRKKRLEMYKAMKVAGVEQFGVSVEHGDQDFLNKVTRKRLDLDEVRATCDLAHETGLLVHANFMIGFPFETAELRQKTMDFARTLDADSYSVSITQPLPGTPIWQIVEDNNLFMPHFKVTRMTYVNVNIIPADISPESLKELADNLNIELNKIGQTRRQATRDKYKSFKHSGKTADGDRKYHFSNLLRDSQL